MGRMGAGVDDWDVDDWDLLNLLFLNSSCDADIIWLVSSYVLYVWEMVYVKKSALNYREGLKKNKKKKTDFLQ